MPRRGPLRIHLDPVDRAVLLALDADPGISVTDLGAQVGVSARTAARRLERLRAADVVQVRGRTLPTFEGTLAHLVRVHGRPAVLARMASAVASRPSSRWVRLSEDRTELMCGLVSVEGPDPALEQLVDHDEVREVHVASLLQVWPRAGTVVDRPSRDLDDRDRALLTLLSTDGRLPTSTLALRLGMDSSTVSRRRRRLIEDGILYLEADLHPAALDALGDAMVWLSIPRGGSPQRGRPCGPIRRCGSPPPPPARPPWS
ncbi:winged helix-turn-helix transcriptional regulator [Brachybacterium sp. EF45031]|uniref:winged helix-turn-helix transcriptional regulator n=1 Tax=Brachybacterium sillae TaxID=2810536 RepID=UPI00217F05AC|nr:winged helix-turn-helix transcriptional regulator [Brachybacterium sillae]MCS6712501.1 winged helix-turn-helix transcriptional regulator [Brachybacterium sillae]